MRKAVALLCVIAFTVTLSPALVNAEMLGSSNAKVSEKAKEEGMVVEKIDNPDDVKAGLHSLPPGHYASDNFLNFTVGTADNFHNPDDGEFALVFGFRQTPNGQIKYDGIDALSFNPDEAVDSSSPILEMNGNQIGTVSLENDAPLTMQGAQVQSSVNASNGGQLPGAN